MNWRDAARRSMRDKGGPHPPVGSVQAMGKLVRRTIEGDSTVLEWAADDEDSVRQAAEKLREQVAAGYVAVLGGDGRNEPIDELPPDADLVVLTMPMGGG